MTTYKIGSPSELKHRLAHLLPPHATCPPVVRVTPRDSAGRKCPAYAADHYEVQAYYTTTAADSLGILEEALRALPEVYMTTQIRSRGQGVNEATNPEWPARRGFHDLRPMACALIRDRAAEVVTFTHPSVLAGVEAGASWADPESDPTRINWIARQASAAIPFDVVDGRPVSPLPATAVRYGRNELGHWGQQLCADAVVLATDTSERRWIVLVERADGHGLALPGGYVDPGEAPAAAAVRELEEETGLRLEGAVWQTLPARGVPDPRASDEAWMVTVPSVACLAVDEHENLPALTGADDAKRAVWVRADGFARLEAEVNNLGGQLFRAHRDLLKAVLDSDPC